MTDLSITEIYAIGAPIILAMILFEALFSSAYNKNLYKKDERTNGEFYVDNLLNEAIDLGYTVKNFEIDHYICWGTPNDLRTYRYWQKFFNKVGWHPYAYNEDYFTN